MIQDVSELDTLVAAFEGDMPLVANLSLATMTVPPFVTQWLERLRREGPVSVLFDRYPFAHLKAWAQRGSFDVLYTTIRAEVDGAIRFAFACQPQTGRSPIFYFRAPRRCAGR